jgi:hypothetical protein
MMACTEKLVKGKLTVADMEQGYLATPLCMLDLVDDG